MLTRFKRVTTVLVFGAKIHARILNVTDSLTEQKSVVSVGGGGIVALVRTSRECITFCPELRGTKYTSSTKQERMKAGNSRLAK